MHVNVARVTVNCMRYVHYRNAASRAKKSQDERDAEARRYHKDTSSLSVKVGPAEVCAIKHSTEVSCST